MCPGQVRDTVHFQNPVRKERALEASYQEAQTPGSIYMERGDRRLFRKESKESREN